jgi:hypothetical protein
VQDSIFVSPRRTPTNKADAIHIERASGFLIDNTVGGGFPSALGGTFINILDSGSILVSHSQCEAMTNSFVYNEVKNPLGGLRGAAQLLERQLPDAEQKAYTRVIIEEADRLAALVDGILRAGGAPRSEEINLPPIPEHVAQRIELITHDGVSQSGIHAQVDRRTQRREHSRRLAHVRFRDVLVGIAACEQHGRSTERSGVVSWLGDIAEQCAGECGDRAVATRSACGVFERQARTL